MKMLLFVLAALVFQAASAQFPYNPLPFKTADFKKIKEKGYTKLYIYEVDGELETLTWEVEYGKTGRINSLAEISFKESEEEGKEQDTVQKTLTTYLFDDKGRLFREREQDFEEYGMESISAYTYNAAGKLVMKQTATIDPPTYKYKYDATGRLKEVKVTQKMAVYEDDGEWKGKTFDKPSGTYKYKYDAKGRMTEEWNWMYDNEDPKPDYKTIWTYNAKGQVTGIKRLNSEGTEMNSETFKYNADGLLSGSTFNDGFSVKTYAFRYCKGCRP